MHGVGISRRVHGDGLDAEFLAGPQDAQRDLAAIGDEDFLEHGGRPYSMTTSGSPYSTGWRLDEDARDRAGTVGRDLVHGLHGFDDQKGLALRYLGADLDERGLPGSGER
jgi:hypothetical protein